MSENKYFHYNLNNVGIHWYLSCNKNIDDLTYSPYLQLRCSNYVDPWEDKSSHYHSKSQEIFILLEGELWMLLNDKPFTMPRRSLLLVQPGVPHMVIGGKQKIRHIVLKVPHQEDKWIQTNKNTNYNNIKIKMTENHFKREIDFLTGFFADLNEKKNQNNWLLGYGEAIYQTKRLCLAYMDFQCEQDYIENNHNETYHYHNVTTEWYLTIKGYQILLIDNNRITISPGYLLRIPEKTPHLLLSYSYPFEGITLRTPAIPNDKIILKE
ncbi:MAG: cupin domain-containing protein [Candidatus Lokiarchaeota archaeon]|nr:cupin domain-containing protein [Candidatus Lokiarchaeota archaeon]